MSKNEGGTSSWLQTYLCFQSFFPDGEVFSPYFQSPDFPRDSHPDQLVKRSGSKPLASMSLRRPSVGDRRESATDPSGRSRNVSERSESHLDRIPFRLCSDIQSGIASDGPAASNNILVHAVFRSNRLPIVSEAHGFSLWQIKSSKFISIQTQLQPRGSRPAGAGESVRIRKLIPLLFGLVKRSYRWKTLSYRLTAYLHI